MFPDCKEKSINSHVLQKNGILSRIGRNNHLIEVKPTNIWEFNSQGVFKYQEIGINDVFTFPGFCSFHDNKIFKPIESNNLDFSEYKLQCLFSLRGLCQEIRRKEQVGIFIDYLLGQRNEFSVLNISDILEDYRNGLRFGIINLTFFKEQLENDIFNNSMNFEFNVLKRQYTEICTSAPLNIKEPNAYKLDSIDEYLNKGIKNKIPTTFVNVIPTLTNSIWIIGEHKQYRSTYTERLIHLDHEQALSELLILRLEYWCMSHAFLDKYIKPKLNEIRNLFKINVLNFDTELTTQINLFK